MPALTTFKFLKNKEYNHFMYNSKHDSYKKTTTTDENKSEALRRAAKELTDVLSDREDIPLTGER
jgi:hypothetical protein